MNFNFDEVIERRSTRSIKWNLYQPDVLPMWVADMDFRCPEPILAALRASVEHGVFGYDFKFADLQERVCERMARLYGWQLQPSDVVLLPGLVTGFNVAARALCRAGDGLLLQTPVYHPMLHVAGWQDLQNHIAPLTMKQSSRVLSYSIDFAAFAAAIQPNTRLFLFCHPHNPVGRVWNRQELLQLAEICLQHNVVICSDEIHSELLLGDQTHIPIAALDPQIAAQTITLIAPSKTFNIPGLGCSFAIITNPELRRKYEKAAAGLVPHVGSLGIEAGYAAFGSETDTWLHALRQYLTSNAELTLSFVRDHMPLVNYAIPQATYLAWLDFSAYQLEKAPAAFLLDHAHVALNDGAIFGNGGTGFARLNFGCPRSLLLQGLESIAKALPAK